MSKTRAKFPRKTLRKEVDCYITYKIKGFLKKPIKLNKQVSH